jgi:hypothetical protein
MSRRARCGFVLLALVAVVAMLALAPGGARSNGSAEHTRARESISNGFAAPVEVIGSTETAKSKGKPAADVARSVWVFAAIFALAAIVDARLRRLAASTSRVRPRVTARCAAAMRAPPRFA